MHTATLSNTLKSLALKAEDLVGYPPSASMLGVSLGQKPGDCASAEGGLQPSRRHVTETAQRHEVYMHQP